MAVVPHTVDVVVADMAKALAFYRMLGLVPQGDTDAPQVETRGANGYTVGFISEAVVRANYPDWPTPTGQRVTLAFRCDSPAEVDSIYAAVTGAGYAGLAEPWDSFWGQRYAFLGDPDGNRVDLFAALEGGE